MHIEDFKLLEPHEQTHFALLRFYVSNWIIEVLNVVCLQPDKDMENKNGPAHQSPAHASGET
jgi:hypothetical protein